MAVGAVGVGATAVGAAAGVTVDEATTVGVGSWADAGLRAVLRAASTARPAVDFMVLLAAGSTVGAAEAFTAEAVDMVAADTGNRIRSLVF
jgi:hypothetical protein